jgi:NADH:ubiquinone oxidoreductase subunit 5 (subunit L)/multisubunit Na+/H+ antiporter MnhA subunit
MLTLALPLVWLFGYGALLVAQFRVGEHVPVIGLKSLLALLFLAYGVLIWTGEAHSRWPKWINVAGTYEFPLEFHFMRPMGVAMIGMLLLMSVIVKYSESYLHKELGFHRFFFLLSIFLSMTPFVLFSDNIDVLFMGWELIGVTSVLLIGFYEHREAPTVNSWWAMGTYRFCDIGLLVATTLAHYAVHTTNLQLLNQPHALAEQHPEHAGWLVAVAVSMVIASMGKAAQWPLTSWVTRAMEGPTPSSALYYGALSISLGPLLLLKMQGLILAFPLVRALVIAIGLVSAFYVFLIAKVRSDAKSILVLSSVFEISIMVVEVGLGLYHWVIFHFLAHATLRTFQFLRSMNAIHDFYTNPLFFRGAQLTTAPWPLNWLPEGWRRQIYYRALEGFGLDNFISNGLVRRWSQVINKLNAWEEKALKKDD